jgi:isopentenyl diphosphate isomerase/L-lactate dehydrogenase-like FMN-dependent dehydrogenase
MDWQQRVRLALLRRVQILREDMERTLRLLGCHSVEQLNRTYLDIPKVM